MSIIEYRIYKNIISCSIHGLHPLIEHKKLSEYESYDTLKYNAKISKQQYIILINSSIDDFHKEYYIPLIEKLEFILGNVKLLGTNQCRKQ